MASFYFQAKEKNTHTQRKKNHKEKNICKKEEFTFKLPFCLFTFDSHFYLFAFAFLFQVFSLGIFFFSSKRKEKKHKEKKTIEKKKYVEKGRSLLSNFYSTFSFLAPTFALPFQALSPDISFFSNKRKKNTHKEKKTIKKK
jgi:hypothetical protein